MALEETDMSKKILVIDDEPDFLMVMEMRLRSQGYEAIIASEGDEGLKKAKTRQPDLILLDIMMPKMDGYTFVLELKKMESLKNTPIIVLTAKDKMEDIFKLEGVSDYLLKPCDEEELLAKIRKHLGQ